MLNKLLIGTGVLFILSLFTGNSLILTICLTLFVIAVAINCYDLWKGQNIIGYMINKMVKVVILIVIGIMLVILSMISMWIDVLT